MSENGSEKRPAVVLLSGGLDSATVLAMAQAEGFSPITALSFSYGQRHQREVEAAKRIAARAGVSDHRVLSLDLRAIGGSALTDEIEVPKDQVADGGIPATYVPARNTVFLSLALGLAEVVGAQEIFFGANALDYSGYPDCRPEFVKAFTSLANVATRAADDSSVRYQICAPLMQMRKSEIILKGLELGVDYGLTVSCYDPTHADESCGHCDACLLRLRGFAEAGVTDPIAYRGKPE